MWWDHFIEDLLCLSFVVKYLGLMAMSKILKTHPKSVQAHKDLILQCLDDKDESIRLRALDLLYGMVSTDCRRGHVVCCSSSSSFSCSCSCSNGVNGSGGVVVVTVSVRTYPGKSWKRHRS